jgi:hypothetical protein
MQFGVPYSRVAVKLQINLCTRGNLETALKAKQKPDWEGETARLARRRETRNHIKHSPAMTHLSGSGNNVRRHSTGAAASGIMNFLFDDEEIEVSCSEPAPTYRCFALAVLN